MVENARVEAAKILQKLHLSHGYSHIMLDNLLRRETMSDAERSLLSRLVYGVEERRLTLDHFLAQCCNRPLSRLHPTVWEILRIGAYQILFMD
ncbi:MAG: 16S rRNA (cytosine(967)-C(5))-methyltransferase RsmB, partial [Clostridia bacterium]|nr:16S rRNA (cytosine(967)-C(5))-methyltransferase RsmB [Clostridia bacterium]